MTKFTDPPRPGQRGDTIVVASVRDLLARQLPPEVVRPLDTMWCAEPGPGDGWADAVELLEGARHTGEDRHGQPLRAPLLRVAEAMRQRGRWGMLEFAPLDNASDVDMPIRWSVTWRRPPPPLIDPDGLLDKRWLRRTPGRPKLRLAAPTRRYMCWPIHRRKLLEDLKDRFHAEEVRERYEKAMRGAELDALINHAADPDSPSDPSRRLGKLQYGVECRVRPKKSPVEELEAPDECAADGPGPDTELEAEERRAFARWILEEVASDALTETELRDFRLRYGPDQMGEAEIARLTGVAPGTTAARLSKARAEVRRELEKRGASPPPPP